MKIFYKIITLVFILIFSACVKDLDFDQAKDIEFEPAIAFPLLNFDFTVEEFQDIDILVNETIFEQTALPSLEGELIQEDLDIVIFHFNLSNELDADITIQFSFIDESGDITYAVPPLKVLANDEGFMHEEEIVILSNPEILKSTGLRSSLNYNGTTLSGSASDTFSVVVRGEFFVSTN